MCAMNSSVTLDSAISVISSLCLEMSARSRSKGPSNTSRCTWKLPPAGACGASPDSPVTMVVIESPSQPARDGPRRPEDMTLPDAGEPSCPLAQPPRDQAPLAFGVEVGEQHGQCLANNPATVRRDPVGPQGQPGPFQVQQLAA